MDDETHSIDQDCRSWCPIPGVTWAAISRQVNRAYRRLEKKHGWATPDQSTSARGARKDIPEESTFQKPKLARRWKDDETRIESWKLIRDHSPTNQYKLDGIGGVSVNGWRTRLLNAMKFGVVRFRPGSEPKDDVWEWIGGRTDEDIERKARSV